jgi:hypothetical protein
MTTVTAPAPPVEPSNPADVLERAADILETDGWVRYTPRGDNGQRCALSAIAAAVKTGEDMAWLGLASRALLVDHLEKNRLIPVHPWFSAVGAIIAYNDTHRRTADEVVATLRAAAAAARCRPRPICSW